MAEPVSVMLLGIGGYGGYYVNYFLDVEAGKVSATVPANLCAAVDPFPESCNRFDELRAYAVPLYEDFDSALKHHQPELIIISTPIHTHASLCQQALDSGASVLLEKPLCGSLAEADQLAEAAASADGFVAIGYQNRYSMAVVDLLDDLQNQRYGTLLSQKSLALRPRDKQYFQRSSWAGALYTAAGQVVFDGPAMNANAHFLYLQLLVADACGGGAPQLKECFLGRANVIENHDTVACTFDCGAINQLFLASHSLSGPEAIRFHYEFSEGKVCLDDHGEMCGYHADGSQRVYGGLSGGYEKIEASLRALRGGPLPACDIASARRHIEVIDQIQQFPINDIPQELIREDDDVLWVSGLSEALLDAYDKHMMPTLCQRWSSVS